MDTNLLSQTLKEKNSEISIKDVLASRVYLKKVGYQFIDFMPIEGSGVVFKALNNANVQVAIKLIREEREEQAYYRMKEISQMQKINSLHVVKLIEQYYDQDNKMIYIVSEFAPNGNLENFILNNLDLSDSQKIKMLKEILRGIIEIQQFKLFHGNLKPQSIVINSQGSPLFTDIGLFDCQMNISEVSMSYQPQEQSDGIFVPQSDYYSAGMILIFMFKNGITPAQFSQIKSGNFPQSFRESSYQIIKLGEKMINITREERMSIKQAFLLLEEIEENIQKSMNEFAPYQIDTQELSHALKRKNSKISIQNVEASRIYLKKNGYELINFEPVEGQGLVLKGLSINTKCQVAIKLIRAEKEEAKRYIKEINLMQKIMSPYVVKLFQQFYDEQNEMIYIVTEFHPNGNLENFILDNINMEDLQRIRIFKSILKGLIDIQKLKNLHGNLKLQSIVINSEGSPLFTDLGLLDFQMKMNDCSIPYAPKEQCDGRVVPQPDYYSAGLILIFICRANITPIELEEMKHYKFPDDIQESTNKLIQLALKMMNPVPKDRLNLQQAFILLEQIEKVVSLEPPSFINCEINPSILKSQLNQTKCQIKFENVETSRVFLKKVGYEIINVLVVKEKKIVFEAWNIKAYSKVAIKLILIESKVQAYSNIKEMNMMQKIKSPYVTKFIQHIYDEQNKFLFIVTEFHPNKSLERFILDDLDMEDSEKIKIFKQILKGIIEIQKVKFLHGNLNPQTIVFNSDGNPLFTGLGLSQSQIKIIGNSKPYTPQEQDYGNGVPESDYYSAGMILLFMCRDYLEEFEDIKIGSFPEDILESDNELFKIALQMINYIPEKRMTPQEALIALSILEKKLQQFNLVQISYLIKYNEIYQLNSFKWQSSY